MPSICQLGRATALALRHRWLAAIGASLLISGCAPLPTDPAADATATPRSSTAAATTTTTAPVPDGPNARPSRWGWLRHDRAGADALAKVAPPPPKLSDKPDPAAEIAPEARDSDQKGLASWYGPGFHGRRTANGERFDSGELTAAHRSLAFGTRVCVRSSVTGKTVVVRINDRGPFAKDRVIDLSQAAAEELGMTGLGIKPVELWTLADGEGRCPGDQMDADEDPMIAGLSDEARRALHEHRGTQKKAVTRTAARQTNKKKK